MLRTVLVRCTFVLLLASTVLLRAADDEEFVPLFNGKDLTGWVNVNCAPDTFTVRDGVIVSTGVPTGVMRTERMYENFVFEVEWRHLQPKGNAGIFVWSDAITAPGVPFTRSHEVQVLDGRDSETYTSHGDVFAIHGASLKPDRPHPAGAMRCLPSEKRCRPSPEWNHYRIECNDGVIKLAVNGKVVSGASECRPRKGYICLEAEGSECHFRNLKIHELPSTKAPSEETANADEGFRSLYTGVDLSGWKKGVPGKGRWQAKNWILGSDESNAVDEPLWTDKEYRDFTLICDWRITADHGDSGIYLRGSQKAQVNIWDDKIGSGIVYGYYGDDALPADLRAAATPKRKVDKPRGQWNRFLITLRGERLTVALNGETVIENARLPGLAETGPLALQPHDGKVEFANLYIKELDAEAK